MEKKSSLAVPIAIVIAGIIIAGAIFFSGKNNSTDDTNQRQNNPPTAINVTELAINPVTEKDYILGNPSAKVVIVEYSDTECPFCKQFHGTMKQLTEKLAKDGTVAWVYRHFPIVKLHPKAPKESEALLCAGKVGGNSGFWAYADRLYAITPSNNGLDLAKLPMIAKDVGLSETAFNTCLSSGEMAAIVDLDYKDATESGGTGTPYNVFVSSKPFDRKEIQDLLIKNIIQYGYPVEFFAISNDNRRVSISGSIPLPFMEELVAALSK